MFSFFKKDLAKLIKRKHHTDFAFVDAYNDLGVFIDDNPQPKPEVFMAYWYARRTCAAALYLQGIWDYDQFLYTHNMFKAGQLGCGTEGLTREFQEQAAAKSVEYLRKYVPQWQSLQLSIMLTLVLDGTVNPVVTQYEHATDEELKEAVFMAVTGIFSRFEPDYDYEDLEGDDEFDVDDFDHFDDYESNKELSTYMKIDVHREFFINIDKSPQKKTAVASIMFKENCLGEFKDVWNADVLCSEEEQTLVYEKLEEIEKSIPNIFVVCIMPRYEEGSPLGKYTISSFLDN
ncbi:hypothetical protein DYB23_17200 [Vibrio cholerae]|uniref:hypothetical protein n=1 Tax=Vibrio cholerae TaxID=666 RepID=UPI000E691408|nr:hypothetical protein [Vibrio cholerae]EGR2520213.1 hypothetical protein [Vibrio cholerae]EGR4136879.1 hypothetical protein [Vibrio cholerae]GHY86470.1 hypothetical protein VCSRO169_3287 [Vibrio cholerae]